MRRFSFVVILLLPWLACIADAAVAADELGRLFFAPSQRAQLDAMRAKRDRRAPIVVDTEQAAPQQGPDVVTYSGVVRRSDGKSTVWINGKPITERTPDSNVSVLGVRRDGSVSVTVPQADRSASLKVGQSMEVMSGTIEEPYARRATIHKAVPTIAGAATAKPAAVPPTRPNKPQTRVNRDRDARSSDGTDDAAAAEERSLRK